MVLFYHGYAENTWAKIFNLKSMANVLIECENAGLKSPEEVDDKANAAAADFDYASNRLRETEATQRQLKEMRTHILNYIHTRETYAAYRKAKHPEEFYEEHRADITIHLASKKYFDQSGLKKLPSLKTLNTQLQELSAQQKEQYEQYRTAKEEMQKWKAVKQNLDTVFHRTEKEKHRGLDR